jgi:hypothetical protein
MDRDNAHDVRSLAGYRKQLIEETHGIDLDLDPYRVRVSNAPLFRQKDGKLCQAIRVRFKHGVDDQGLKVRLLEGDSVIDEQEVERAPRPQSLFLLVPEVEQPVSLTFELEVEGSVIGGTTFDVPPQRKWTIHLVHHSHYDIGYTDPQSEVLASQLAYIDAALELATLTDEWPEEAQFRWNIEVNWPLQEWLRTRPGHARDMLIQRIQEGRIEVHALPFSMHTEAYSFDELARQLSFTAVLRHTYGIDVVSAMQTDVPGATIGLATLLTDARIKYFSVAHNYAGRSVPHLRDGQELTRPFYWQAPDGERLLVWYTDTLYGVAYMEGMTLGFGSGYDDVMSSLPEYLNALAQSPYPYGHQGDWLSGGLSGVNLTKEPYPYDILHLRIQGAFADNASPSLVPAQIVREWNQQWEFPRLRMSLDRDFFIAVEEEIGDQLATYEGDWTDWWADGIGSAAVPLGRNRQSQNDIRTAQTLHALADLVTDEPKPQLLIDVDRAYEEMALFDEHTWGAANPWEQGSFGMASGEYQWTRKASFAYSAEERVRTLLDAGKQRIAPLGAREGDTRADLATLFVFNPSSFMRTDLVRVFLPERSLNANGFGLIDLSTGESIPFMLEPQANAYYRPRGQYIRFLARDIPSFGYARFGLKSNGHSTLRSSSGVSRASNNIIGIENQQFSLELDLSTATISSLLERRTGDDLIPRDAPYGFNGYIYDRYTSAPGFNHLSSRIGTAGPWLLGSRDTGRYGLVVSNDSNDVWEQIIVRYSGEGADWLETTLTLPHDVPRLHIRNRLHKPTTMQKESVYFAFPFAVEDPEISFEITGGVVNGNSRHVPGSAHYFRAIRQWATITSSGSTPIAWATREAPLVQVGNIHLPYAPFPGTIADYKSHHASIYSWALNNIWDTNFPPQQGGEMTFHYTVATGSDTDAAMLGPDTGASTATPFIGVTTPLGASSTAEFPDRAGFVRADHPDIEVTHLGSSRSGGDFTVFLVSHADVVTETMVQLTHLPVASAQSGTFLETELVDLVLEDGTVRVTLAPGEMKTLVVRIVK